MYIFLLINRNITRQNEVVEIVQGGEADVFKS